ncbi:hypothetical protein PHJA_000297200 [Phtheirospermum japonicum]|uniref:Uncharacterized protein n=1 Tax=Phtheirospermum japonicum TaxID=374723 RepID=A0A830B8E9_9LAMI|nr:hypothetical protein PHJA_000297200 [Phtheirospermum japonicum]
MNPAKALSRAPTTPFCNKTRNLGLNNIIWAVQFHPKFPNFSSTHDRLRINPTSVTAVASNVSSAGLSHNPNEDKMEKLEVNIEKVIYGCRFFAILAVWGSLVGSFLCFVKGCVYIVSSFQDYFLDRGKVISSLVEATDVYLLGTVMLVFGMGLYELFISNLDKAKSMSDGQITYRSNLFGLFALKERPRWLEIKTVNELKTKLGHVIVMLLLIGLFDKSKKAVIQTPFDLLCFSASVLLSSGCLFLLSKLNDLHITKMISLIPFPVILSGRGARNGQNRFSERMKLDSQRWNAVIIMARTIGQGGLTMVIEAVGVICRGDIS